MLRVAEICKEKGITQQKLAKDLGIQYQSLYAALNGNPKLDTLQKIADILNVSIIDLFDKKDGEINGYLKVKGTIYEITSFEDLEKILELKDK